MRFVVDSNILVWQVQKPKPTQLVVQQALDAMMFAGHDPGVLPQNFYEYWVVATRPSSANGLGRTTIQAVNDLSDFRLAFTLLPDNALILPTWEHFVSTYAVVGKPAHDARIAAAMAVHGVAHLLTFNTADFARYPGVIALDPHAVAAGAVP